MKLFEAIGEAGAKDGGFVFQTILSYKITWQIVDGETKFDQKNVNARLHQVDAFPDLKFMSGYATLSYAVLSEVTLLKRKIDLATDYIKGVVSEGYFNEIKGGDRMEVEKPDPEDQKLLDGGEEQKKLAAGEEQKLLPAGEEQKALNQGQKALNPGQKMLDQGQAMLPAGDVQESVIWTSAQRKEINDKYFKGTIIDVVFEANNIVLREVSASSLDGGNPKVTLKLSTGMVDTLDGKPINSWDNFKVTANFRDKEGNPVSKVIDNKSNPPISRAIMFDSIDNDNELIFRTILPSVILEFKGDSVQIDTYSNRSNQVAVRSSVDFDNLFNYDSGKKKTEIEEPEEGEVVEASEEPTKTPDTK
jgi:hypothetical protein